MRQTDDFEDNSGGLPIIYMALGVSVFILAEPLKVMDIPGALLILGAAIVSELPERKKGSL